MAQNYLVRLQAFEGPLDLLLHLINEAEVDIYDIPISEITHQYLGYIREAQSVDLEVATEFLVMAATLMLIKARMLVPAPPSPDEGMDWYGEGDDGVDPREDLVRRLLEYRRYKEAAKRLSELEAEASSLYSREACVPHVDRRELPLPPGITVADLYEAFQRVINARKEVSEPFRKIPRDEINVGQAMRTIHARLVRHGGITFDSLFDGAVTRSEVIATFLAVLELVRMRKAHVTQAADYATIMIGLREDPPGANPGDAGGAIDHLEPLEAGPA